VRSGSRVDAAEIELPVAPVRRVLDRDAVPDLPVEALGDALTGDGPCFVGEKGLPFRLRNQELGEELPVVLVVDGESGTCSRGLIDAAEPAGERGFLDPGNLRMRPGGRGATAE
jgi:hypothetical protein